MTYAKRVSRRELLRVSFGAGVATLLLHGRLRSAEAPVDPNRFVLLSDTHISSDKTAVRHETNSYDNFVLAREQYLALDPRPAGLILAGDCVFLQGEKGDYERLRELVAPITLPLTFAMGNHDRRENFWSVFPEQQANPSPVPGRHVTVIEAPHADWFVLDSLDRTNSTPGRLGEAQLQWLAAELDRRPDKPALIVLHHYPLIKVDAASLRSALIDTPGFYEVILPRKRVKAYIYGHSHQWNVSKIDDLHLVNLPALAWVFDAAKPQGWVDAQLKPDGLCLTLHCLNPAHEAHGQRHELTWR